MKLHEIYEYYGNNWAKVSRELKLGTTTVQNWKKWGYIPIESQIRIERETQGLFKARTYDAQPPQE